MKLPRSLWVLFLTVLTTGCSRFQMLNALVPSCGYQRTSRISYGPLARQKLDVYVPNHVKPGARVVVFFYGGSWQYGQRGEYAFVGEALSSRGFIAVLPDYRLYPPSTFPSFLQDGALAVRWARDNAARFGGDPNRIYLMGHSAGAYIAVMLTLDNEYLKAVGMDRSMIQATAGLSGPYDFVLGPNIRPVFGLKPNDPSAKPEMEPINFVDGHAPPILLLQGLQDQTVEPGNAPRLGARIKRDGGKVKFIGYPNLAHVGVALALAAPFRWLAPVLDDTVNFFSRYSCPAVH
jgi:acetyl esterase/lipase